MRPPFEMCDSPCAAEARRRQSKRAAQSPTRKYSPSSDHADATRDSIVRVARCDDGDRRLAFNLRLKHLRCDDGPLTNEVVGAPALSGLFTVVARATRTAQSRRSIASSAQRQMNFAGDSRAAMRRASRADVAHRRGLAVNKRHRFALRAVEFVI